MSNYKKFSLDTIKQKLKNGEYAARVGAMRAIGKTQELSEADKVKARALVDKHFGTESAPAAKPKAKKAAKKVSKKVAKKVAKATAPKLAKTAAPKKKKAAKKASKKAKPAAAAPEGDTGTGEAPSKEVAKAAPAPTSKGAVITEMSAVISTVSESLKAMEAAKRMFPKASLEHNVEMVTGAMTRAVRVIDEEVTKPRLGETPAAPAAKAAAPARKKAAKKGTRAKATTTPPPAEEAAAAAEPSLPNGAHEESELSEEEQEQLRLARETQAQAD